jgi:PAS domain S-box-containing protein
MGCLPVPRGRPLEQPGHEAVVTAKPRRIDLMIESPGTYRVLVVEDEPTQRLKLAGILTAEGYRVDVACNGEEGLASAQVNPPHLILSDIEMPEMDGYALCQRIRADQHLRGTKVVLLTSHSDVADVITGLANGADSYIAKPYETTALLEIVQTLLETREDPAGHESAEVLRVRLGGRTLEVRSTRQQILNFFLNMYRDAVTRREELSEANEGLRYFSEKLTHLVEERTAGLRESERRFREMLENIKLIALTLDNSGKITFCNDYLLALTGWSREEVINKDWLETFIPEETASGKDPGSRSFALSPLPTHHESHMLTKEGKLLTIQWNNTVLRDAAGMTVGTASIGEDVTERNRAQEKARQLAAIVQSSEVAIIGKTLEGIITSWNKGAEKIYGYTEDEIVGRSIATLVPPGIKDELQQILDNIRTEQHVEHYETLRRRKDGRDIVMSLTISPIIDAQGNVVAWSTIGRDVSERKLAEEHLKNSEERFRLIAENVGDMIAVLDLEGRRIYNSPSYKKILGDPESLKGTNGFQEIHPDDVARVKHVFQETVSTGLGQRIEYRFLRKDGTESTIDSKGSVIRDSHGTIASVVVVSRDVTEEKKLAAQFLRAQRMESIGTLAGGIAHDLNNVLTPIMMSIEVLRSKISDPLGLSILSTIETSSRRGADIVRQVLAFGRGVKGDRILVQIKHVVKEVVKIAGGTLPKSIKIKTDIPQDLWTVSADPTQMHQVFLNLFVNARDAMPNGGVLTISAENITLDETHSRMDPEARPGSYVTIKITDTGTGIPSDIREKIFEPFFTTKEIGMGTGLGLSTTLAIVKSHGGFINLESEMGKGTTFRIYIPATGTTSGVPEASEEEDLPMGNGELILIIDDEAAIREITKETLQAHGYKAVTAGDGAEGVAIFAENKRDIKVVITDMMMPVMDGTTAILALKRIRPDVKIIAASGMLTKDQIKTPSGSNVEGFLAKPYTAEKLLNALAEVLK